MSCQARCLNTELKFSQLQGLASRTTIPQRTGGRNNSEKRLFWTAVGAGAGCFSHEVALPVAHRVRFLSCKRSHKLLWWNYEL